MHSNGGRLGSGALQGLSDAARGAYVDAVASATQGMFRRALPFFVIALLVALSLRDKNKQEQPAPAPATSAPKQTEAAS